MEESSTIHNIDDVYSVVSDGFSTTNSLQQDAYDGLVGHIVQIEDDVTTLATSSGEGVANGYDTLAAGLRVQATEGLVICIMLALLAGIQCWRVLADRWV